MGTFGSRRWWVGLLLALVFVGVVAPPAGAKNEKKSDKFGTYQVAVAQGLTTTNYWEFQGVEASVFNGYLLPQRVSLYSLSPVGQLPVPLVAVDEVPLPTCNPDGCYVDIPLRKDVVWSDKSKLTAEDVVFTLTTAQRIVALGEDAFIAGNWRNFVGSPFVGAEVITDERGELVKDEVRLLFDAMPSFEGFYYRILQTPILQAAYWEPIVGDITSVEDVQALYDFEPVDEPQAGPTVLEEVTIDTVVHAPNPFFFREGNLVTEYDSGGYVETGPKGKKVLVSVGDQSGAVLGSYEVGPFVEQVVYSIYATQEEAVASVADGSNQYFLGPLGVRQDLLELVEGQPGVETITNETNAFRYLAFNTRPDYSPMADVAFRTAVATLVDKEAFAEAIAAGVEVGADRTVDCFVVDESGNEVQINCDSTEPDICRANVFGFETRCPPYLADGLISPVDGVVSPANVPWYNPDISAPGAGLTYAERLAQAAALLEAAGYSWENEGGPTVNPDGSITSATGELLTPDGVPVGALGNALDENGNAVYGIEVLAPGILYDPIRAAYADHIGSVLTDLRVPVVVNRTHFFVIVDRVFASGPSGEGGEEWDMYMLGWGLPPYPSHLDAFFRTDSLFNTPGYSNPAYDALADQFAACQTVAECRDLAFQMQEIVASDLPYLTLFTTPIIEAYRSDAIVYPFTKTLDGFQDNRGIPHLVQVLDN